MVTFRKKKIQNEMPGEMLTEYYKQSSYIYKLINSDQKIIFSKKSPF